MTPHMADWDTVKATLEKGDIKEEFMQPESSSSPFQTEHS